VTTKPADGDETAVPVRRATRDYGGSLRITAPTLCQSIATGPSKVSLEPGVLLQGTYRIDRLLATGGMGDVYQATHERLGATFAVKLLHRDLLAEKEPLARFETEAKVMASLHHPHIVQVFDFNRTPDGTPFLVMELAEGQDLRTIVTKQHTLSPQRVAQIVEQTASALGAAHARGVIHRDLKPENVVLVPMEDQSICVKLVDFGVSKTGQPRTITVESTVIGTPGYMSPEQAQGHNGEVDPRSDQFALATLAYTLLTGCEAFEGQSPVAVLYKVVHEEPVALTQQLDYPCSHIQDVLQKAMAKDREGRYHSITQFARAFVAAVAADVATGADPGSPTSLSVTEAAPPDALPASRSGEITAGLAPESRSMDVRTRARRHRSRRSRHPWRLAAMTAGACILAATISVSGPSGTRRVTFSSERVRSAYSALSSGATRIFHLGTRLISERTELRPPTADDHRLPDRLPFPDGSESAR
jgi:serine/threonine protein kinase